jgi:hypothetical protein
MVNLQATMWMQLQSNYAQWNEMLVARHMKTEFSLREARCWQGIIGDYDLETEKYSRTRERISGLGVYLVDRRDKIPAPT